MARMHLFELEDQSWFPDVLRTAMTGYMRLVAELGGHAHRVAPILKGVIDRTGARQIVDLGSGAGGPTLLSFRVLSQQLPNLSLTLTDLHPNLEALRSAASEMPGAIRVVDVPVDASRVPATLPGVRTLMNTLHHFRVDQARAILQSAVDAGQPVVVVELLRRHPVVVLACLLSFVPVLLSVPFLRPFRWWWLVWTYLVPVIPLAAVWDGVVSSLRAYSESELRDLVGSVDAHDSYHWEFGTLEVPPSPVPGSYLVGIPRSPAPVVTGEGASGS